MYNKAIYVHMYIHVYNTAIYMYICIYRERDQKNGLYISFQIYRPVFLISFAHTIRMCNNHLFGT